MDWTTSALVDPPSQVWLNAITEFSQDAIIGATVDGTIISWNPAAQRLFGYPAEEMIGRSVDELVSDKSAEDPRALLATLGRGIAIEPFVVRRRTREGLAIDIAVTLSPVRIDGEMAGAWAIAHDATGELAEQRRLRRDLEAYRLAFAGSPLPMWIYDVATLRVLAANEAALSQYGYTRAEFCALGIEDFYLPRDLAKFRRDVLAHPDQPSMRLRAQHVCRDGQLLNVQVSGRPIQLANGLARLVVSEDVTGEVTAQRAAAVSGQRLDAVLVATIEAIAATVDKRDPYTAGHQRRVAELASAIANRLGLSADTVQGIALAAGIHDIGKIAIPTEILAYPAKLSPAAFELVKTHCQVGHDIIAGIDFPWPIAATILQHHERLDGSGYPNGLRGDAIIAEARIVAVADVTEAISSHRPYRASLGSDAALAELRAWRGTRFDIDAVDACIALFVDERFTFSPRLAADSWRDG